MAIPSRMPQSAVRNDGAGPYAVFGCEKFRREFRSQPARPDNPQLKALGEQTVGGLLHNIPVVGDALASSIAATDLRHAQTLTPAQLNAAWQEVQGNFRECPNCGTKQEPPAPAPILCPTCGTKTQGAKFCPNCGTKVS